MPLRDENGFLLPVATGVRRDPNGVEVVHWALFSRADVEQEGWNPRHPNLGTHLTGWSFFDGGPGRAFGRNPVAFLGRSRILVTQCRGLDV